MAGASDSRTERPTSRRLHKAREKGQIARSKDVPSAAVLLGTLILMSYFGKNLLGALEDQMRELLRVRIPADMTVTYMSSLLSMVALKMGISLAPVMIAAVAIGIAANLAQGGLAVSWEPLSLKFDKLNPRNGLSKVFSKNGLVELAKSICMLVIVTGITYQVVVQYVPIYPRLVLMNARQLLIWTASISYQVLFRVSIALAVLAVFDYAFQRYRFMQSLKMTKQEVKQEFKESEGDPLVKGRIRRIQREMARKRMMAAVPEADVVVTNPTHYAVALSYRMGQMEAPKVVAKGVGFLALRIKELAHKHDVPLVENRALAQTLYKTVEVGEYIPGALYQAVAEILAYVYKARNAWKNRT
jgi:flagellar biosynthesis protein FlhB